jgi:hypothetical protein
LLAAQAEMLVQAVVLVQEAVQVRHLSPRSILRSLPSQAVQAVVVELDLQQIQRNHGTALDKITVHLSQVNLAQQLAHVLVHTLTPTAVVAEVAVVATTAVRADLRH